MSSRTIGYARVSSRDQNENRQIDLLLKIGVKPDDIFIDKESGKDFNRPKYNEMIANIHENDTLYISSIDRLGRNYEEIIVQWKKITKDMHADIVVLDMPLLDTRESKDFIGIFISDLILQIQSFVAENERNNIRTRQREGIIAAKNRGVKFGRPKTKLPRDFSEVCLLLKNNECSIREGAKKCKMKKSTFYNKVKEAGVI
ncbi:recombinase family protein [Butyrivibrio sp. YAB3001]|uniref:recombinase family protein n=1 Tax=Butyrivibrio sp. YAB3001 TaxID=1520812 RepID=UPI0008F64651|nr:recombinase family protein [Butyrivibrio sp. YAB3001]SFC26916.1 Site-specific DNA recombinase [Butyrivibrio sp. YAB3001]